MRGSLLFIRVDQRTHQAQPQSLSVNGTSGNMDEDTEQAVQLLATCARGIVLY